MDATLRDRIAMAIAAVAIVLGVGTLAVGRFDSGIHLAADAQNRVVVSDLDTSSQAWRDGLRPGMVVIRLAGVTLMALPQYVYSKVEPSPDPSTGEVPSARAGSMCPRRRDDRPGRSIRTVRAATNPADRVVRSVRSLPPIIRGVCDPRTGLMAT